MHTPENMAAVAEIVSIHRRSQQLNNSETSLRRILPKDPGMKPNKAQLVQDRLTEDADLGINHFLR